MKEIRLNAGPLISDPLLDPVLWLLLHRGFSWDNSLWIMRQGNEAIDLALGLEPQ